MELGSVSKLDLASSGLFFAWLHPAASTMKPTSPASPSLPDEKSLALGPTTEFSDGAWENYRIRSLLYDERSRFFQT
jgi:hypothetical protein